MRARPVDPEVQRALTEAGQLPSCAAQLVLYERAATLAESMGDLDSAWRARCRILEAKALNDAPRFSTLFMNLAWCLAMSDSDPERFSPSLILWQYKWVTTEAPLYASVPRQVLFDLVEDMNERFLRSGWGARAGIHKRLEVHFELGEYERALTLIDQWQAVKRDRGSDCNACELDTAVFMLTETGRVDDAVKLAKPLISGKESCSVVPQATFGPLLIHLVRRGQGALARELFDKGRRLIAGMDAGGARYAGPYLAFAAATGDAAYVETVLRSRLADGANLPSDKKRLEWFTSVHIALSLLTRQGVEDVDLPIVGGISDSPGASIADVGRRCREIAEHHAQLLDARNGNNIRSKWLAETIDVWHTLKIA